MALDDYVVTHQAAELIGQGILQESTTKNSPLGSRRALTDGRVFRYCLNGSTALAAGKIVQGPAWVSTETALAVNTAAAGDTSVTVTTGSAIAVNLYTDGYLIVEDGDGATVGDEGGIYKIKSHPVTTGAASCVITLYDPIRTAFAAASTVGLVKNPYNATVLAVASGGTLTSVPLGVPIIPVTASYYYWAQTWGVANVLCDSTPGIGKAVCIGTVAGSVALLDMSGALDFPPIGVMMHTGVDTEYRACFLRISP